VNQIDLNNPPPNHTYKVNIDRDETDGERRVRLFKDLALFVVALGFVLLVGWLCYSTLTSLTASADEKKWAMSIISATAGGLVGYLIRK
jgi:hypothetical protein